jgi:uncharacterized membrane protein YdbT with pleckstrin-like domain
MAGGFYEDSGADPSASNAAVSAAEAAASASAASTSESNASTSESAAGASQTAAAASAAAASASATDAENAALGALQAKFGTEQTASFTATTTDQKQKMTSCNHATVAIVCTIDAVGVSPDDWAVGDSITLWRHGAAGVSFAAGAGVTLRSADGNLNARAQYSTIGATMIATDEWLVYGDLS